MAQSLPLTENCEKPMLKSTYIVTLTSKTGYLAKMDIRFSPMTFLNHNRIMQTALFVLIWLSAVSCAHATPPKEIVSQLQAARENLRISQAASNRIAIKLDELKKSGTASQDVIDDYEAYLKRLQALTNENRRVVRQMEAAYCRHYPCGKPSSQEGSKAMEPMLNPPIPEEQTVDDVAALDKEFNDSLAKFDDMLLKEFEAIRIESSSKMRDLSDAASEAAERLKERGIDLEADEQGTSAKESDETEPGEEKPGIEEAATEKDSAGEVAEGATPEQGTVGEASGEDDRGKSDSKRGGYDKDDDIVARQLREAAEKETDPKLKEKLWKEYEAYKKSTR